MSYLKGLKGHAVLSSAALRCLMAIGWLRERQKPVTVRGLCGLLKVSYNAVFQVLHRLKRQGIIDFCGTATIRPLVRFIPAEQLGKE